MIATFTLIADAAPLIEDGKPVALIVLPTSTEFDALASSLDARVRERVREVDPDAADAIVEREIRLEKEKLEKVGDEELFAAEELQAILQKISGAKLEIVRTDGGTLPDGPSVVLGSELARRLGFGGVLDGLDRDGFVMKTDGDRLVLAGRRARGTLYAVYAFLESLGCRWVMPGEFGELYPERKTVVADVDATENPGHRERYFWCTYGHADGYPLWTLRNRGNFVRAPGDELVAQGHGLGGALKWAADQERFTRPTGATDENGQPVRELRPELQALSNGKPSPHLPNITNPEAWDLYAEYYIDQFRRHPMRNWASLSAEDGIMLDERAESRLLASNEFDFTYGYLSSTDQLWHLHNRILERVGKVFPDRKFGVLVYANNQMPPRIEKLHPNMALVFAPLGVSPLTHVRDDNEKTNRAWRAWLEDWMRLARASGVETYYYDYEPIGFCWNMAMICPRWKIIGLNYPYFHELGLTGHTGQGHDDWASSGLNNYLMQRLYWTPQADYREIIRDYCQARFGAAADAMFDYYELLGDAPLRTPSLYGNEHWANHLVLTPELRTEARKLIARAQAAADTPRAKAQVAAAADVQAMTDAMCDAIEHANATGDFLAAADKMREAFAIKDRLNKIYPNFVNERRMNTETGQPFETGGQYMEYRKHGERIASAPAKLLLPRTWKGANDLGQAAFAEGLHRPDAAPAKLAALDDLDITVMPDVKYGTEREPAAFFYRTEVDVPRDFANKKATLYFPGLIARALEVWVNGEPVIFESANGLREPVRRGPRAFWEDYNTLVEVDVTDHLRPGETNTIAFRAFKATEVGGSFRRVYLLGEKGNTAQAK